MARFREVGECLGRSRIFPSVRRVTDLRRENLPDGAAPDSC
jgi:hypothetical protein